MKKKNNLKIIIDILMLVLLVFNNLMIVFSIAIIVYNMEKIIKGRK